MVRRSTKIFPSAPKNSPDRKPDIIQLWSPAICFGRCYGIIPLKKCWKEPHFERCTGSFCWALLLSLVYIFTLIISILVLKDSVNKSSTVIVESTHYVIYYFHCEMTLIFFLLRSDDLVNLLQQWIETERLFARNKIQLGRVTTFQCWLIYLASVILSTIENAVYIFSTVCIYYIISYRMKSIRVQYRTISIQIIKAKSTESGDLLSRLAGQETHLESYFGEYSYIYTTGLILIESLSEVAWITGDFVIALISVLLRRYFEGLQEQLRQTHHDRSNSSRQLEELRRVHLAVSTLAQAVAKVFSPLILLTVGFNITYILTFLYSGLEEDLSSPSYLVRFMFTYSFIYLMLRFTFSAYLASRLTEMVNSKSLN